MSQILATEVEIARHELYERAERTDYHLRVGISWSTIEAHAGVLTVIPVRFYTGGKFDFTEYEGEQAVVIEAFRRTARPPWISSRGRWIDLLRWRRYSGGRRSWACGRPTTEPVTSSISRSKCTGRRSIGSGPADTAARIRSRYPRSRGGAQDGRACPTPSARSGRRPRLAARRCVRCSGVQLANARSTPIRGTSTSRCRVGPKAVRRRSPSARVLQCSPRRGPVR
jgi:hypothetical protein